MHIKCAHLECSEFKLEKEYEEDDKLYKEFPGLGWDRKLANFSAISCNLCENATGRERLCDVLLLNWKSFILRFLRVICLTFILLRKHDSQTGKMGLLLPTLQYLLCHLNKLLKSDSTRDILKTEELESGTGNGICESGPHFKSAFGMDGLPNHLLWFLIFLASWAVRRTPSVSDGPQQGLVDVAEVKQELDI